MRFFSFLKRTFAIATVILLCAGIISPGLCYADEGYAARYLTLGGHEEVIGTSSGTLYVVYQVNESDEENIAGFGFSYDYSCNKPVEMYDRIDRQTSNTVDGKIYAKRGETVEFSYSAVALTDNALGGTYDEAESVSMSTQVSYNLYDEKEDALKYQEGTSGTVSLEVPKNPEDDWIYIFSDLHFEYEGTSYTQTAFEFAIEITDYDPTQEVSTDAITTPGEDKGISIPLAIISGMGAVAAAAGGAVAATLGSSENPPSQKPKQYLMKVFKEFGDTIVEGDSVNVYARIVEVSEDGERTVPELTQRISISCSDGVFDVSCQDALAGEYKGAWVSVAEGNELTEGNIDFVFRGAGGSLINHMKFKIGKRQIKLYQDNIALPALDEKGAEIGFTLEGVDPKEWAIDVFMSENSSYAAAYTESENAPGTYFAVLADINTNPGEAGTYSEQTLTIKATSGDKELSAIVNVYRVTPGLCIGAETLNCYRALKKEAIGKEVQNLEASDFTISKSEIAVMCLVYDEENKSIYYRPVDAKISFEPIEEEKENSTTLQRLEGIGLQAVLKSTESSASIYEVACTKGWLEPPTRCMAMIVATVDETDESGNTIHLEQKKEVLLQSQPLRERPMFTAEDEKIERWLADFRSYIYDANIALRIMDLDALGGELAMIDLLEDSYDEHYGYDPILVAQIQYNVNKYIHDVQMNALRKRQAQLEDYQATAIADANSTALTIAHSFKMTSDKYLDNWLGITARIGLGFFTGGASEAVFLTLDTSNAVVDYYDRTPLSARNGIDTLIAGSVPVVVTGLIQGSTMVVGAMIPQNVKDSAKNWVMQKTGALMTPRVQNAIFAFKDMNKRFVQKIKSLKSLTYNPKTKCLMITEAASSVDNVVAAGRSKALMSLPDSSKIARTKEGELLSTLCDAANRRGFEQADKFVKATKSGNPAKMEAAFWEVKKDSMNSFAINKLNVAGKTRDQILAQTKVANNARATFNQMDDMLLQDPASNIVKKEATAMGLGNADDIVLFKGTGNSTADAAKGCKIGLDTDVQIKIKTSGGKLKDIPADLNTKLIGKGYCTAAGLPCETDAQLKSSLKKISVEAMNSGHEEAYWGLKKVLNGEAVSEGVSIHNMTTRYNKIISGVNQGKKELQRIVADKAAYDRIIKESADFAQGKISYDVLSAETKDALGSAKKILDSVHQTNKTLNLDLGKEFKSLALGNKPTITQENVSFALKCDFAENLGNYDLGLLMDDMAARGTSYETEAMKLIENLHKVNSLCQGVSEEAASSLLNRTTKGLTSGVAGTINDSLQ